MDGSFGLPRSALADVQTFYASAVNSYQMWRKRPGATMLHIIAWGAGGNGGNGVVGAVSTAAGGGGGGSGAQVSLMIPAHVLPERLYVLVGTPGSSLASRVCVVPTTEANSQVLNANIGGNGGNASGATGGAAGSAGAVSTISAMPLAGMGIFTALVGQAGIIGGTTGVASALTVPTTGLYVTGGTGGGGLPAAAAPGASGGSFFVTAGWLDHNGGAGGSAATTPPATGSNGHSSPKTGLLGFRYGGTGGGSTHGSATGAGLVGALGGNGGYGCGGGGGGGALTGSTQGLGGRGGDGLVIITQW